MVNSNDHYLDYEPEFLAENKFPEGSKGTLSVDAARLFVRTDAALHAIGE